MSAKRRAVVLLSGGLDSATTLGLARAEGFEAYALTFRYGQRHAREVEAARRVGARRAGLDPRGALYPRKARQGLSHLIFSRRM